MSKAILVIDMPETCTRCNLCYDNYGCSYFCSATGNEIKESIMNQSVQDWCPLKPAPNSCVYSGHPFDQYGNGFADGYNTCLEEILGQ